MMTPQSAAVLCHGKQKGIDSAKRQHLAGCLPCSMGLNALFALRTSYELADSLRLAKRNEGWYARLAGTRCPGHSTSIAATVLPSSLSLM